MASLRQKQNLILAEIEKWKKFASKKLLEYRLFKAENDLEINGLSIESKCSEGYKKCNELKEFYLNNSSCFAFKLIDGSIITAYLLTDKKGNLVQSSYGFCSCPFVEEILKENLDEFFNKMHVDLSTLDEIGDKKAFFLERDLNDYFSSICNSDTKLVKCIIDLAKNPIYFRCDYDKNKATNQHPKYHLTLNFIHESRFKIDKEFTILDFVNLVLDMIYGKKEPHSNQFLRVS